MFEIDPYEAFDPNKPAATPVMWGKCNYCFYEGDLFNTGKRWLCKWCYKTQLNEWPKF